MKNILNKIGGFIKKNKGLSFILLLLLILLIIITIIFIELLSEKSSNKYGSRLNGIKEVKISDDILDGIENSLEENSEVEKANIRIQGKIVYLNITYKNDTTVDRAKEIANSTIINFKDDELKFYDLGYFLIQKDDNNAETKEFYITGTKHPKMEYISWIKG